MHRRYAVWYCCRAIIMFAVSLGILCMAPPVAAHPADEINERDLVHIKPDGITIEMAISAGALTVRRLWADADTNGDATLDTQEREAYGTMLARGIHVTTDSTAVALTYLPGTLDMKSTERDFTLQGADATGATVTAQFAAPFNGLDAPHEITITVQHYTHVEYGRPAELYPDATAPLGVIVQGGSDVTLRITTMPGGLVAPPPIIAPPPHNPNHLAVATLQRFVRAPSSSLAFSLLGLGIALLLGALHALTPGHGKTLVAAYMIGSKGRIRDAVTLGSVVTATHTGSVIAAGVVMLIFSRSFAPDHYLHWIELGGSICILGLGIALLPSRVTAARSHGHHHVHRQAAGAGVVEHEHVHVDGTRHSHGWFGATPHEHPPAAHHDLRSLLALGVGGGIVPCPDALAILLIAIAAGHIITGIIILLGFSAGLAAVLTGLGILLTRVRITRIVPTRLVGSFSIAQWLPVISALMIVLIGLGGLWRAVTAV